MLRVIKPAGNRKKGANKIRDEALELLEEVNVVRSEQDGQKVIYYFVDEEP